MKWFEGSIAEAVAVSQSKKSVFCVAILGTDELSLEILNALNSNEVQSILGVNDDDYLWIKITADSVDHTHFSQIYTNPPSPSIYCITDKGIPVEIITTSLPLNELSERLKSALSRHRVAQQGSNQPTTTTTNQSNNAPAASSSSSSNLGENISLNTALASSSTDVQESSASGGREESQEQLSLDERTRRAREMAAAKRRLKAEEEADKLKAKEKERREAGKGLAEFKRFQEEEEMKRILEERKRDKLMEQQARQRIKEQIAEDRAARNRISNVEMLNKSNTSSKLVSDAPSSSTSRQQEPIPSTSSSSSTASSNFSGQVRLQFRLPGGSSQTHSFSQETTLGEVRRFLIDNGLIPIANFGIWVAFPRREFVNEDYLKTLKELGLIPSAALLLLPTSGNSVVPTSTANLMGWLSWFMSYLFFPVTFLTSLVSSALPSSLTGQPGTSGGNNSTPSSTSSSQNPRSTSGDRRSPQAKNINNQRADLIQRKRNENRNTGDNKGEKSASGNVPKEGNVHRLRSKEHDSDDEDATWNGNSTQQM